MDEKIQTQTAGQEVSASEKAETEGSENTEEQGDKAKYETTPVIERARVEREKLEAANLKKEELLNREEAIMAKRALGGESEAGQTAEKPKELSDTEYAEALEKGEVNPLKDDGLI